MNLKDTLRAYITAYKVDRFIKRNHIFDGFPLVSVTINSRTNELDEQNNLKIVTHKVLKYGSVYDTTPYQLNFKVHLILEVAKGLYKLPSRGQYLVIATNGYQIKVNPLVDFSHLLSEAKHGTA